MVAAMIDLDALVTELKTDEGFEPRVYQCSANKATVAYGWNLEDNDFPEHIATDLLKHALVEKIAQLSNYQWFCELSDNRKQAIANMAFNIGVAGVLRFKKMVAAIEAKDYDLAALEMQDSKWYNQVGYRAVRLVNVMRWG
jgi:lysozyme